MTEKKPGRNAGRRRSLMEISPQAMSPLQPVEPAFRPTAGSGGVPRVTSPIGLRAAVNRLAGEAYRLSKHADALESRGEGPPESTNTINYVAARSEANSMLRALGIALHADSADALDIGEAYFNAWMITSEDLPPACSCPTCQSE